MDLVQPRGEAQGATADEAAVLYASNNRIEDFDELNKLAEPSSSNCWWATRFSPRRRSRTRKAATTG